MKLAVMQPYFLPYLGYYQLVNAVDKFVFFDDVNFIKKGWINRNQILEKENAYMFSIPLVKASQNKLINEIALSEFDSWKDKFLKIVEFNYKKAPYYAATSDFLKELLNRKAYQNISELAAESVMAVAEMLQLPTQFAFSSQLDYNRGEEYDGQQKILSICKAYGADMYINPKNGVELYDNSIFEDAGIDLKFIHMDDVRYNQFNSGNFVPYLSILDVLMFNSPEETKELLNKFNLK